METAALTPEPGPNAQGQAAHQDSGTQEWTVFQEEQKTFPCSWFK